MNKLLNILLISLLSATAFSSIGIAATSQNQDQNSILNTYRYLFATNPEHAIDLIDANGMEGERFFVMANLSAKELAKLLETLFAPQGGDAIKHWAYNPLKSTHALSNNSYYHKDHAYEDGFEADYFYISKAVRASQYIIFFLEFNPLERELCAKHMAQALNLMNPDIANEMLYGRFDARFLGDRDRLVKNDMPNFVDWTYQSYDNSWGFIRYYKQSKEVFNQNTVEATVPLHLVRLLVPYLNTNLLAKMTEREDDLAQKKLRVEL